MVVAPRTLDLSKFHGPERLEFAKQALEAFVQDGFFKITGHGIPTEEITRLLA
jgi:isopenicillin N synthase-like dioxygenase